MIRPKRLQTCLARALTLAILIVSYGLPSEAQQNVIIGVSGNNFSFLPFQVADESARVLRDQNLGGN